MLPNRARRKASRSRLAVQLLLIIATFGPTVGLLIGRMLWRVGERRYGDLLLTREFLTDGAQPNGARP
jgi:hypothetical protein